MILPRALIQLRWELMGAVMAKRKRWTITKRGAHPVDAHVGSRVRLRRAMLGVSQTKLAELLGLSFQQVQKNEKGTNRIGASRLYELSQVLDVPVMYFFAGLDGKAARGEGAYTRPEALKLARAYYGIKSARVRKRVFELVKAAAKAED